MMQTKRDILNDPGATLTTTNTTGNGHALAYVHETAGGGRMTRNEAVEITGNCKGSGFGVANAL